MNLILPESYDPRLTIRQTQEAIKYIRDTFQKEFGREMNLERISAPLCGEERWSQRRLKRCGEAGVFRYGTVPGETIQVVHSLAKWKRMALHQYGFKPGKACTPT